MPSVKYYATMYVGRATDPTETTVLTPAAGASHSDDFKVADVVESGYKNYLDVVDGRRGQIDPLNKKVDTGRMTLVLVDKRVVESNNAQRWVTAFFGDAQDGLQCMGHKVVVQADYGAGKTTLFTGRVDRIALSGKNTVQIDLRDMNDDLRGLIFTGLPHASITYVTRQALFPSGFLTEYAGFPIQGKAGAIIQRYAGALNDQATAWGTSAGIKLAWLTIGASKRLLELVPQGSKPLGLEDTIKSGIGTAPSAAAQKAIGVYVTHTSGAYIGQTGRYTLDKVLYFGGTRLVNFTFHALRKADGTPDTGAAEYLPIPVDGVTADVWMTDIGPPTKSSPLYLNSVNPGQLVQDICDGKFGPLTAAGATRFTYAYDAASVTAIKNDTSLLTGRWIISKPEEIAKWLQKNVYLPWNIAYALNANGEVTLIDMRLPTTLGGLVTLTDDDDAIIGADGWEVGAASIVTRVSVTYYSDRWVAPANGDFTTAIDPIEPHEQQAIGVDFGRESTLGEQNELSIDATGFRYSGVGDFYGLVTLRRQAVERFVERLIDGFRFPFGVGAVYVTIPCKRTTNVLSLAEGDWVGGDFAVLPNPGTNERGGARLYQVVGIYDRGGQRQLTLLDYGKNVASTVPAIGVLSLVSGNEKHEVQATVTLGAGDPARVDYATTGAAGSEPAPAAADWRFFTRLTTSGDVRVLAGANQKVWVRVRTESGDTRNPKLPSAWVKPSNNGLLTNALAAPTGLTAAVDGGVVTLSWTPGELSELNGTTEIYNETPSPGGDPTTLIDELTPGGLSYVLYLSDDSTQFKAGVRHRDLYGGVSAMATYVYSTGTINAAPAMTARPGVLWGIEA